MPKHIEPTVPAEIIERKIYLIRGHKVLLDSDLAELYKVETFNLNKAVKRNLERFPEDFMFQLILFCAGCKPFGYAKRVPTDERPNNLGGICRVALDRDAGARDGNQFTRTEKRGCHGFRTDRRNARLRD